MNELVAVGLGFLVAAAVLYIWDRLANNGRMR